MKHIFFFGSRIKIKGWGGECDARRKTRHGVGAEEEEKVHVPPLFISSWSG